MNAEDFHAATVGDPSEPLSPQVVVDAIQILRAKGCREISVVLMAAQASDLAMEDGGKICGCDVSIRYPLPNTSPSGYAVGSDGGLDRIVISIVSARASKAGPCSVEPPGFVSKTIGFGAPCPDCGHMVSMRERADAMTTTMRRIHVAGCVSCPFMAQLDGEDGDHQDMGGNPCGDYCRFDIRAEPRLINDGARVNARPDWCPLNAGGVIIDASGDIAPNNLPACSDPIMPDRWPPAGAEPWPPGTWRP